MHISPKPAFDQPEQFSRLPHLKYLIKFRDSACISAQLTATFALPNEGIALTYLAGCRKKPLAAPATGKPSSLNRNFVSPRLGGRRNFLIFALRKKRKHFIVNEY